MAMEIEIADVSNASDQNYASETATSTDAAAIVNGAGVDVDLITAAPDPVQSTVSQGGEQVAEPAPEEITSTLVDEDGDNESFASLPEVDEPLQREMAELSFQSEIAAAKEEHFEACIARSDAEAELKEAKADEKAALKNLKNLIRRGPNYPKPVSKIEEAVANDKDTRSAIVVDDPAADTSWKRIATSEVIAGVKGMGDKKAEAIIELAPTLGDLEELRAQASKAMKPFATVLPKGIGRGMADEVENRILEVVSKHCLGLAAAKDSAVEEPINQEGDQAEIEATELEITTSDEAAEEAAEAVDDGVQAPEWMDVDDL